MEFLCLLVIYSTIIQLQLLNMVLCLPFKLVVKLQQGSKK